MTKILYLLAPLGAVALLGACSNASDTTPSDAATGSATAEAAASESASATESPLPSPVPSPGPEGMILRLEGLADLAIGSVVPANSDFKVRGAQTPGSSCTTYSSPSYPGVYALAEQGVVKRISVGGASKVKLVEGIGVGSSESDVLKAFPGFRSDPHKYIAAPAKYLTQPGNDPRLRFEIGDTGRVSIVHVGVQPQLSYVEGCS